MRSGPDQGETAGLTFARFLRRGWVAVLFAAFLLATPDRGQPVFHGKAELSATYKNVVALARATGDLSTRTVEAVATHESASRKSYRPVLADGDEPALTSPGQRPVGNAWPTGLAAQVLLHFRKADPHGFFDAQAPPMASGSVG